MMKQYIDFKEVEGEIREYTKDHPIIYKYRNWEDKYHKKIITEKTAWFAHPFSLNDPHDFRPPYNFITKNIDWEKLKLQMFEIGRSMNSGISDAHLKKEVEIRFHKAKADPTNYFNSNREPTLSDDKYYNQIGIFSCCLSEINETMWAYYGNNHNGFAIGFDTLELCKELNCAFGKVRYSDEPIDFIIQGDNDVSLEKEIFQKSIKWSSEEEFRFISHVIGISSTRDRIFSASIVKELIFGLDTAPSVQEEIMAISKEIFPHVGYYKVKPRFDKYGLQKYKIK